MRVVCASSVCPVCGGSRPAKTSPGSSETPVSSATSRKVREVSSTGSSSPTRPSASGGISPSKQARTSRSRRRARSSSSRSFRYRRLAALRRSWAFIWRRWSSISPSRSRLSFQLSSQDRVSSAYPSSATTTTPASTSLRNQPPVLKRSLALFIPTPAASSVTCSLPPCPSKASTPASAPLPIRPRNITYSPPSQTGRPCRALGAVHGGSSAFCPPHQPFPSLL